MLLRSASEREGGREERRDEAVEREDAAVVERVRINTQTLSQSGRDAKIKLR